MGSERAIVSPVAGTTRDAVDETVQEGKTSYRFVDTAGIRRKGKTTEMTEKMSVMMARRNIRMANVALLVIDATDGVVGADATIAGYAHEEGRAVIIVVNKWDIASDEKGKRAFIEVVSDQLKFLEYAPVIFTSAKKGEGIRKIFATIRRCFEAASKRVTTGELNRFVDSVKFDSDIKMFYITQASIRPPTFMVFTDKGRQDAFLHGALSDESIARTIWIRRNTGCTETETPLEPHRRIGYMKALVADPVGGPENLKYIDLPTPEPGDGEVLVKIEAIGVNFTDIYFRKGFYKTPETPVRLGNEGAGTIAQVGKGVKWPVGARVAYTMARGSYAEYAAVPQNLLVELPEAISFEKAAAVMLQGMTAHYLANSTFSLKPGNICLIHAAAGGAGLLLVQIAKIAGATVIGTVSTPEKEQLVKEHGADHTINYTQQDFVAEVKKITEDKGVDVVYDSVGKTTFHKSLDVLKPRGLMVSFGQSAALWARLTR